MFFGQKLRGYKIGVKRRYFTCQTDFAFISRVFICCGCNFTWSTSMYIEFFRIFFTNLQKCSEKILFSRRSEDSFFRELFFDSLRHVKSIFSDHFWRLVNKIQKNVMYILVPHVKLQPQQIKTLEMRVKSV